MKRKYLFISIFAILILSIGGVYSYFSAVGNNTGDAITGQTNDIGELNIVVARVNLNPNPTPSSDDLVPAEFGVTPDNMTTTLVNNALNAKCVSNGYTGCHVWKITATSTQTIPSANIKLNLTVSDIEEEEEESQNGAGGISKPYNPSGVVASPLDYTSDEYSARFILSGIGSGGSGQLDPGINAKTYDESNWSYVVYTGTDSSATSIINKGRIITTFPNTNTTIDIHNGQGLTANTPQVYYVMVYLNNVNSAQNDGITAGTTDARGRYNGTVSLEAMNGTVKASFYEPEPEPTDVSFFNYAIENNEVTITWYHGVATYTVSDQSACESYIKNLYKCNSDTECITNADQICENGTNDWGETLEVIIIEEAIPSSDYAAAGLSNVVITPAPTDVIIPSTIEGYPVVRIKRSLVDPITGRYMNAPFLNAGLTSVNIPNSVTSIGEGAFYGNPLTSITIGNENVSMGNCAFGSNPPLEEPFLSNYVCN